MSKILSDHNGGVSENTFFHHVRELENIAKQEMSLKAKKKAQMKAAKEDGIDVDDLKWAQKERARSEHERRASHNRRVSYLRFFKVRTGVDMNFIDETVDDDTGLNEAEREDKWTNFGFVGSREGKGLADVMQGHDPNSDTGRWITAGWERGQAENAKPIKKKSSDTDTGKMNGGVKPAAEAKDAGPKHEPEVETAKRRGRPPKDGITFWHKEETKQVFKVSAADAPPEGAKNITKKEYERLAAEYEQSEKAAWEGAAPAGDAGQAPAPDEGAPPAPDGDDDGWDTPPSPDAA